MIKAPELWRGGFELKANFGPAALLLTKVDDSAILLFSVGDISQDKLFAHSDGRRQSNEATMSAKNDGTRWIFKWSLLGRLAMHDHRQLRRNSL
jgi:hypothetical protein